MKPATALSNAERFPLIEDLSFLFLLQQDEAAPLYNFKSGDRLTAQHLKKVNRYAADIQSQRTFWAPDELPLWLPGFVENCCTHVPFYKNRSRSFNDQPTIRRGDIKKSPWNFVSDEVSLADLLVYQTSGTTGPPMDVVFDPASQACWLPQLQSVLSPYNIQLPTGSGNVAIALICSQAETLTYASLSTYLRGAGVLKINVAPAGWRQPWHRPAYLEKYNPAILTGDPFAFMALLELAPDIHPEAIVSSAMKLSDGLKKLLEERFQCPVLDIYSLTECRMVAVADGGRHKAIRPDLYLEIFDAGEDKVLPYGERGELVVSGGNNPFLPLIRYRTGDFCSLEMEDGVPYLIDLEARAMVVFYDQQHHLVNTIDISRAMMHYPLAGFTLHQHKNKNVAFTGWSNERESGDVIKKTLQQIFGSSILIDISMIPSQQAPASKPVCYSSDFSF